MPRYGPVWLGALLVALLAVGCFGGALTLPASEPVSTLPTAFPEAAVQPTGDAAETCDRALKDEAWPTAVPACERAREGAPTDATTAGRLSKAYLGLGRSVLSVGSVEEALRWFERAREVLRREDAQLFEGRPVSHSRSVNRRLGKTRSTIPARTEDPQIHSRQPSRHRNGDIAGRDRHRPRITALAVAAEW